MKRRVRWDESNADVSIYDAPDSLAGPGASSEDAVQPGEKPAGVKVEPQRRTKQKVEVQTLPGPTLKCLHLRHLAKIRPCSGDGSEEGSSESGGEDLAGEDQANKDMKKLGLPILELDQLPSAVAIKMENLVFKW